MAEAKHRNKQWLEERLQEGKSLDEISDEAGVSRTTISRWTLKHELRERDERLSKSRKEKYKQKEWLLENFLRGYTATDMVEDMSISTQPIYYWSREYGIENKSPIWCRKDWLKNQIEKGRSAKEMADKFSRATKASIIDQLNVHGLTEQYSERQLQEGNYRGRKRTDIDKDRLKEAWVSGEKGIKELSWEFDCSQWKIQEILREMGLGRNNRPAFMYMRPRGYICFTSQKKEARHHRLLAVVEYGIEYIKDKHIHHKSVEWDNRPEVLKPLTKSEHASCEEWPKEEEIHDCPRDPNPEFTDREWLQEAMDRYGSVEEIARICDRDTDEIQHWVDWYGIQKPDDPLEW